MTRSLGTAVSVVALAACAAAGCGGGSNAEASTAAAGGQPASPATPVQQYTLAATRRCLVAARFRVGPIGKPNPRLQALGDLAQRSSLAARSGGKIVGLGFGDAPLLAELLAVPIDPYTIETRGNALLLYLPSARRQAAAVRACLRP
jgi:hypothetical protein